MEDFEPRAHEGSRSWEEESKGPLDGLDHGGTRIKGILEGPDHGETRIKRGPDHGGLVVFMGRH